MNEHEFRFVELSYRLSILKEVKNKIQTDLNDNAVKLLLGEILSEDRVEMERRKIEMLTFVDVWIAELTDELDEVSGDVFVKQMEKAYKKINEELNKI